MHRSMQFLTILLTVVALPAHALVIQFTSTTTDITYFAAPDPTPDVYVGMLGAPGSGIFHNLNFVAAGNSFAVVENVPTVTDINRLARIGTAYSPTGESETHRHNFVFSISSPGATPASFLVSYDATVFYVANDQFQMNTTLVSPVSTSFDLGQEGILDMTLLLEFFPFQGVPTPTQGAALPISARFLLHDVPQQAPEPGAPALVGLGLAGLLGWRARRTRNTPGEQ